MQRLLSILSIIGVGITFMLMSTPASAQLPCETMQITDGIATSMVNGRVSIERYNSPDLTNAMVVWEDGELTTIAEQISVHGLHLDAEGNAFYVPVDTNTLHHWDGSDTREIASYSTLVTYAVGSDGSFYWIDDVRSKSSSSQTLWRWHPEDIDEAPQRIADISVAFRIYSLVAGEDSVAWIMWNLDDDAETGVYLWEADDEQPQEIAAHDFVPNYATLDLNDDYLTWVGITPEHPDGEVYRYDRATQNLQQLTDNDITEYLPQLAGERVVWLQDYDSEQPNTLDIMQWDAATDLTTELSNNIDGVPPRTSLGFLQFEATEDYIMWIDNDGEAWRLNMLAGNARYSVSAATNSNPRIDPFDTSQLVWTERSRQRGDRIMQVDCSERFGNNTDEDES